MCDVKINDIVKCIDKSLDYWDIHNGYLYKIVGIRDSSIGIQFELKTLDNKRIEGEWLAWRFEKVKECKKNLFSHFDEMKIDHKIKSVVLSKNGAHIKIYNDLTSEGGKRIELWNIVTYHNDKCEIADEKTRKAIESACEIYDMVFA